MPKRRLTIHEQALGKVHPYLVKYHNEHNGLMPSLREVAKQFKKTPEWVRYCYKVLIKAKLIKVAYYKQRGVVLINN